MKFLVSVLSTLILATFLGVCRLVVFSRLRNDLQIIGATAASAGASTPASTGSASGVGLGNGSGGGFLKKKNDSKTSKNRIKKKKKKRKPGKLNPLVLSWETNKNNLATDENSFRTFESKYGNTSNPFTPLPSKKWFTLDDDSLVLPSLHNHPSRSAKTPDGEPYLVLLLDAAALIVDAFAELQVPAVLSHGGALGAERHWGLIPWDEQDLDLSIFTLDKELILRALTKANEVFVNNNGGRKRKEHLVWKPTEFGYHVALVSDGAARERRRKLSEDNIGGDSDTNADTERTSNDDDETEDGNVDDIDSTSLPVDRTPSGVNPSSTERLPVLINGPWLDIWIFGVVEKPKRLNAKSRALSVTEKKNPRSLAGDVSRNLGGQYYMRNGVLVPKKERKSVFPMQDEIFDNKFLEAVKGEDGKGNIDYSAVCVGQCSVNTISNGTIDTSKCELGKPERDEFGRYSLRAPMEKNQEDTDSSLDESIGSNSNIAGCARWFTSHQRAQPLFDLSKLFPLRYQPYGPYLLPVFKDTPYYLSTQYSDRWSSQCSYEGVKFTKPLQMELYDDFAKAFKYYYDRAIMPCVGLREVCNFAFEYDGDGKRKRNVEDIRMSKFWSRWKVKRKEVAIRQGKNPTVNIGDEDVVKNESDVIPDGVVKNGSALFRGGKLLAVFDEGKVVLKISEEELRMGLWSNATECI